MVRKPPGRAHVLALDVSEVDIGDIAFSLAYINRYNGWLGACSVGQHCICVAERLPRPYALHGLLHDASEAYLQDMINPMKGRLRICPSSGYMPYRKFEKKVMRVVYAGLRIKYPSVFEQRVVKLADVEAAELEQRQPVRFFETGDNRPCKVIKRYLTLFSELTRELRYGHPVS